MRSLASGRALLGNRAGPIPAGRDPRIQGLGLDLTPGTGPVIPACCRRLGHVRPKCVKGQLGAEG